MHELTNVSGVAHVIQLSVAPVFLLTGVGAILGVLVNRLGRVIDRFRALERHAEPEDAAPEMRRLSRRARMIHWAIGLCTSCALLVCIVIASLFGKNMVRADVTENSGAEWRIARGVVVSKAAGEITISEADSKVEEIPVSSATRVNVPAGTKPVKLNGIALQRGRDIHA